MSGRDAGATVELEIEALGATGDGLARLDGRRIFLPLSLPGERWRARIVEQRRDDARAIGSALLRAVERADPPCVHFGRCGGCALQHVPAAAYAAFKRDRVVAALARVGLGDRPVAEAIVSPQRSRRRVRLAYARSQGLGYRGRRSHDVVRIDRCPIARPEIEAMLAPLRAALACLDCTRTGAQASLTITDAGVDLLLDAPATPTLADRERLAAWAAEQDLAAVVIADEGPIAVRRAPTARFGSVAVRVPPGTFLQATQEGERALQDAVAAWLSPGGRVVDLFAGLGTLSLPMLDSSSRLLLLESDAEAVAAVSTAVAGTRTSAIAQRRDLCRSPLTAPELASVDAVILDPPRAGAAEQVHELARSGVATVVYASCSPASFARDARALDAGGLRLREVRPIDQFLFSAEIELVARFTRNAPTA